MTTLDPTGGLASADGLDAGATDVQPHVDTTVVLDALDARVCCYRVSDLRIAYCNGAWAAPFGGTAAELVGRSLSEVLDPDDLAVVLALLPALIERGSLAAHRHARRSEGDRAILESWTDRVIDIHDAHHVITCAQGIPDAPTDAAAATPHDRIELVLGALDTAVLLHDRTGRIELANAAAASLFGESDPATLIGTHTDTLLTDALHESGRPLGAGAAIVRRALDDGATQLELGLPADDDIRWLRATAVSVPGDDDTSVVCALTDVTVSHNDRTRLAVAALTDPLTGLANRAALSAALADALADSRGGAVLFIDLDRFKPVNDMYGHDVGDQLLVAVANRLLGTLAAGDTVARIGGDEFVVLVRDGHLGPGEVDAVVSRIVETLATPFAVAGVTVTVGASVGAAILDNSATADEVLATADRRMYAAKRRSHRASASARSRIGWAVELALGVDAMDSDHRELVALLAAVAEQIDIGDTGAALLAVDTLIEHTVSHFAREEALMASAGYPPLSGHQIEHRRLVTSVARYRDDLAAGIGPSPTSLVGLLAEWLTNHITGADRAAADWIHAHHPELAGPGPTP